MTTTAAQAPPGVLAPPSWVRATAPAFAAPLRAVDRLSCRRLPEGLEVVAELAIGAEPDQLRGHFPGLPIFPGVYLVESLVQAVALAVGDASPPRLRVLRSGRFLAALTPGDTLRLHIRLVPVHGGWEARADAERGDGVRAARLVATLDAAIPAADIPAVAIPDADVSAADWPAGEPGAGDVPAAGPVLDQGAIRALLPHRHPMLLIDRVSRLDAGRIWAEKAITATEWCYRERADGWPADRDAYPASLLLESLGQAAALLWLTAAGASIGNQSVLMFASARDFRITGTAQPGDVVRHVVELSHVKADTAFASGVSWVGNRRIATVDSLAAVRRPRSIVDDLRHIPTNC